MLEHIFSSKTRVKLLNYFLRNPDQPYFVRELTRLTGEHINSIRRELGNLLEFGLISETKKDQKKYYKTKKNFLLYNELRALFTKTDTIIEQEIQADLDAIGDVDVIILTGIFTGVDTQTDLLMAGKKLQRKRLENVLEKFSQKFGKPIRFTFLPAEEYRYRVSITDKFLYDIMVNKKLVLKDEMKKVLEELNAQRKIKEGEENEEEKQGLSREK